MKLKKLLSIGAMGLVVACSTSVATYAVDTSSVSTSDKEVIVAIAKEYKNGDSIVGINKNTKVSDVVNASTVESKMKSYENGKRLLRYLDLDDGTINSNLKSVLTGIVEKCNKSSDPDAEFETLKGEIVQVADKVLEFDNAEGTDRANKEKALKTLMNDAKYNLSLGKNTNGTTTISIEDKSGNIELQINKDNVESAIKIFKSLTLDDLKLILNGQILLD